MTKKIEMAHVVRAHMQVAGCPVLTSNQCHAIAMNLNCMVYPDDIPTPPQPIYDEDAERTLFEAVQDEEGGNIDRDSMGYYENPYVQSAWDGWLACAQSRDKSLEVGHE